MLLGLQEAPTTPNPVDPVSHSNGTLTTKAPNSRSLLEQTVTSLEDFDDPDFDVMAELDADLCCEDLFDELRTDRGVRVSKMEAKVRHFFCQT